MRGIEKLRIAWRRLKLKIKEKELREKVPETYEIEKIIDKIKVRIHPEGKPWVDVSKPILVINKLFEESKPVEI